LSEASISVALNAARLNLRIINILARTKPVKMVGIQFVSIAAMKKPAKNLRANQYNIYLLEF
jgi:hypothetical protein